MVFPTDRTLPPHGGPQIYEGTTISTIGNTGAHGSFSRPKSRILHEVLLSKIKEFQESFRDLREKYFYTFRDVQKYFKDFGNCPKSRDFFLSHLNILHKIHKNMTYEHHFRTFWTSPLQTKKVQSPKRLYI